MDLQRIKHIGLSAYTYILSDSSSGTCVVIDPVRDITPIVEYLDKRNLVPAYILETHVHADYLSGAPELKAYYQNTPLIYGSSLGGKNWVPEYADVRVIEGTKIVLNSLTITALHTPGHTPEHIIWLGYDILRSKEIPLFAFTGDLLFAGSVGRPDLLGPENAETLSAQLYDSLFKKLQSLPDSLEIYPAHGAGSSCGKGISSWSSTTLGYERLFNPFLQTSPFPEWKKVMERDMPAPPQSFKRIKKMNLRGPLTPADNFLKPPRLDAIPENALLIDVREPEVFSQGHVAGAINVPEGPSFCNWASMILPDQPIVLVLKSAPQAEPLAKLLWTIGLCVIGYIVYDEATLNVLGLSTSQLPILTPQEAVDRYIIDVRTPAEWRQGHIPSAVSIELATIAEKIDQIPRDKPLSFICAGGNRSSVAASYLQHLGFTNVSHISGGMHGWHQARLPVEKAS